MTETVEEPRRKATRKSPRRSYADARRDLESRIRYAMPVLENATAEDALLRIKTAIDILKGV